MPESPKIDKSIWNGSVRKGEKYRSTKNGLEYTIICNLHPEKTDTEYLIRENISNKTFVVSHKSMFPQYIYPGKESYPQAVLSGANTWYYPFEYAGTDMSKEADFL